MKERAFWAQDSTRWGEDPRALCGTHMALMASKPPSCNSLLAALFEKNFSLSALPVRLRRPFLRGFGPLLAVSWRAFGCSWPFLGRSWPPRAALGTALCSLLNCVKPLWGFSGLAGAPPTSIWCLLGAASAGFSVRSALFWRTLWAPGAGWRCCLAYCVTAALFVPCGLLLLHRWRSAQMEITKAV